MVHVHLPVVHVVVLHLKSGPTPQVRKSTGLSRPGVSRAGASSIVNESQVYLLSKHKEPENTWSRKKQNNALGGIQTHVIGLQTQGPTPLGHLHVAVVVVSVNWQWMC